MNIVKPFVDWLIGLIYSGSTLLSWFLTPIDFGFAKIMPLALLGIDGLLMFLTIAVGKWILA